MDQKILIAAAIALAFLPQIVELLKAAKSRLIILISKLEPKLVDVTIDKPEGSPPTNTSQQTTPASPPPGPTSSRPGSPPTVDPAVWVNDLFALQQILLVNDRKEAASLVGEAIVELVNTTTTTKNGGSRK